MNKPATAALYLGLSIFSSHANATTVNEDFQTDLLQCEEQAAMRMASSHHSSTITSAINSTANIGWAIIAGSNPRYAIAGAAQSGIHGVANDAQIAEYRKQALIDQCMNEKRNSRPK